VFGETGSNPSKKLEILDGGECRGYSRAGSTLARDGFESVLQQNTCLRSRRKRPARAGSASSQTKERAVMNEWGSANQKAALSDPSKT